jgi:hypothetical protein
MWWKSIRSLITLGVAITFCYLATISKIEAKDFMVIVILVFNFYYLNKDRNGGAK